MVEMAHRRVQPEHDAHREASGHGQRAASVTCEISLAALATAVGCARLFIRSTLQALGLDHLAEDAEVVASELVTNAVQATGITHSSPRWSELHNLALIRLRLVMMGDGLIIEVWDRDAAPPKPRQETALDA